MRKRKKFTKKINTDINDPKAPIIIKNNTSIKHDKVDRMLLYRMYENNKINEDRIQKNIESLHVVWEMMYDLYSQKKKLEKQLEEVNEMMSKYKEKFGDLDDEENNKKTKKETTVKKESNVGLCFILSALIVAASIFGGAYYLKR